MGRSLISFTALWAAAAALQPAAAQISQPANPDMPGKANVADAAPAPIGFVLAPGVTFAPSAFSEVGYDSNPAQAIADPKDSAFIRSGAGFNLSSVSPRTVVTVSGGGSVLEYFNDAVFTDPVRYAGYTKANVTYLVQPGITVSSGAFIDYDGQSVDKNQTAGANTELGYRDDFVSSVLRARFLNVQYLNGPDVANSPLILSSAYNYNRSETTWTGLLGNSWRVAPYGEVSVARVDYTDQPDPAALDRSADDYHLKGGLRLTVSPALSADAGWRYNWRDTDDRRVTSFDSNSFDGSLTWRPSPFFFINAAVERYIGEPVTGLAVLADVRSYSMKVTYLPVPGVAVSATGGYQVVSDIGSGVHYHWDYAEAQAAWDYNDRVQFYTALRYQNYDIRWQNTGFDDVRVTAGMRIVPDGQGLLSGESLESLMGRLADGHRPINSELTVSTGYSWFGLPDMKMVTIVGGPFFNQALGQQNNGDGNLNGLRTDARLANFAEGTLPDGRLASFSVSGFFANYQGTTNSHCMYSLTTDCAIVNIVDFDATQANNTGPFGNLNVTARRNVDYYGIAVDSRFGDGAEGGFKDAPPQELSPFKLGVAMRGLSGTANLISIDPLVSDPAKYKEKLNTLYSGGFMGVEKKVALGEGWTVGLDATAGLYYTDTDYQGRYNGYTLLIPGGYVQESGAVNSNLDRGSFIGTVRLDLKRQLGWGTVGIFGQGEYLSYVPRVAYNNNDEASGVLLGGLAGTQVGTRVMSGDAVNYTSGLSVSVPVN
ncbi:MAG: outer membrane beta-barrel protein [Rhodomicrobium sp.]